MGRKLILLSLVILIFSLASVFAGGASEGKLIYLPRNVVNNSGVMIELSQTKRLTSMNADYVNTSTGNLALFRLRDTLRKDNRHTQPSNGGVVVTIESLDSWQFVHEDNPTSRIDFALNAFCTERNRDGRNYNKKVSTVELGDSTQLYYSKFDTYFKEEAGTYKLLLPYTTFDYDVWTLLADYIREIDICVVIPNDVEAESGYYTTTMTITSTSYTEYDENGNSTGTITLSETVTIRGYIGVDPGTSFGSYSFFVSSTADTYSMDLDLSSQTTPYLVANVQFLNVNIATSEPNKSTQKTKFTVYISPTSNYKVGGTGSDSDPMEYRYKFIKMGSENQSRTSENTIYYDLCLKTSANGYTALKSCTSNTTYATGSIGSAGVYSNSVKTTFKILPEYDYDQISKAGLLGGTNEYKEIWQLDQDIYLKLTNQSMQDVLLHQPGVYYSTIYFTMEAN